MNPAPDRSRTLDELDPPAWGEPGHDSYLVTTCHRLRRKPLRELSIEEIGIMIGQGIGLAWLIPLAVEALEAEPRAAGGLYPGDLLTAVLRVEQGSWSRESGWRGRVLAVLDRLAEVPERLLEPIAAFRTGAV